MRKLITNRGLIPINKINQTTEINRINTFGQGSVFPSTKHNHGVGRNKTKVLFSSNSRQTVMRKNLQEGLIYVNKQYNNLIEINNHIRSIVSSHYNSRLNSENVWSIYLDSIVVLSEERFSNFSLFGNGSEPPIRIHLIQDGVRSIHEIPVNHLLNCLHFQSLLHSGTQLDPPPEKLLHYCVQEVVQQMLLTDREIEKVSNTLNVFNHNSATNDLLLHGGNGITNNEQHSRYKNSLTLLNQFFRRLGKA